MGCVRRVGINPRGGPTDYSTDSPRLPHAAPSPPLPSNDALDRRKERGGNIVLATRRQKEPRGHRKDDSVPYISERGKLEKMNSSFCRDR